MNQDFAGKSALVVGGTSGIGKAVARLLLQRGAASVSVAGRNVEKLRATESELSAFGKVTGCSVDITDKTDLARVLRESGSHFASHDLLVNAAGVFLPKLFLEQTMEDYDRYLELNRGILLHHANGRERDGGAHRRIHREHRIDVGAAGGRGDALLRVLDGESGIARINTTPRHGACAGKNPGQCRFARPGGDTHL